MRPVVLKHTLYIYLNHIQNVLTHVSSQNIHPYLDSKHNHSVNTQQGLHSQLGSSKVFHNWLAFLILLRSLFASQLEKNGEIMSSSSPMNNPYLPRCYTLYINRLAHNSKVQISHDIQTEHTIWHIVGDRRTYLCFGNRNKLMPFVSNMFLNFTNTHSC